MIRRALKRLLRRPDYSNGQWHSWHGGKCPVAPSTRIEGYVYLESDKPSLITCRADALDWHHEKNPIARFRVIPPAHPYDWQAMGFDPSKDILYGFDWDKTPEGYAWWSNNEDTREGWDRHDEMKRLYAEDMEPRA